MKVRHVLSKRIWMVVAIALLGPATLVRADIMAGTYTLGDHPDGNITGSAGPYGFRADFLPPPGSGPTFSFELGGALMKLVWDGSETADGVVGATISGTLFHNTLNVLWSLTFDLTGVSIVSGGFEATGGTGTLWENATMNSIVSHALTGKQDGSGIAHRFLDDAHRLNAAEELALGPEVGRGWVVQGGTNDFLYTASLDPDTSTTPVPEPASLAIWSLVGLLGMVGYRRRFRNAA